MVWNYQNADCSLRKKNYCVLWRRCGMLCTSGFADGITGVFARNTRRERGVYYSVSDCVDRCHVWPHWASRCKPWRWMLKDISIHRAVVWQTERNDGLCCACVYMRLASRGKNERSLWTCLRRALTYSSLGDFDVTNHRVRADGTERGRCGPRWDRQQFRQTIRPVPCQWRIWNAVARRPQIGLARTPIHFNHTSRIRGLPF